MEPTSVVGRRVAAFIIDGIIAFAINIAIFFALATKEDGVVKALNDGDLNLNSTVYGNLKIGDHTYSVYGGTAATYFLLSIVIGLLYWVVLPGLKGFTLGKLMLGIRVVKDDGTLPIGIGRSFARQFLWIADAFPYVIPYLTGFIVAMTGKNHQRIGDRVANTLVVKAEAVGNLAPAAAATSTAPPPLAPEFQGGTAPNWPS
jgi:uncharacterized RDD family membrane protein YckC